MVYQHFLKTVVVVRLSVGPYNKVCVVCLGELMGDLAYPDCWVHGGEERSLLIPCPCGEVLLEHGQLQCGHGVLGRSQVWHDALKYLVKKEMALYK